MKLNRLGAFTFGVVITAVSVGAVTFANAAGDATLKACANKTTGAMRYLSKGSCKKTETSLSWSQMGPQGLPGATGATGAIPDVAAFATKSEVIGKTFTTATIPTTPIPSNNNVLVPGQSTEIASASELLGMSARSYTRRYEIPLNWVGKIDGRCPTDAPVPLTYGVYALDATGKKFGDDGWPEHGGYAIQSRASIDFYGLSGDSRGNPPMTLFVTQVCGPITSFVAG